MNEPGKRIEAIGESYGSAIELFQSANGRLIVSTDEYGKSETSSFLPQYFSRGELRWLRYGTLICDLERGIPLDLLPDRSVETVSAWLQSHPSIEIISRDRASEYATAARKSAPQAVQVADRWHLAKNLTESLSTLLTRCCAEIRRAFSIQISQEEQGSPVSIDVPDSEVSWSPRRSRSVVQMQRARRTERVDRYEHVISLQQHGLKTAEIAHRVGMSERTVRSWLSYASYPEPKQRRRRPSLIDPYQVYVQQQWHEGLMTGPHLYQELKTRGYQGSERAMYRYLETLRLSPIRQFLFGRSHQERKRG